MISIATMMKLNLGNVQTEEKSSNIFNRPQFKSRLSPLVSESNGQNNLVQMCAHWRVLSISKEITHTTYTKEVDGNLITQSMDIGTITSLSRKYIVLLRPDGTLIDLELTSSTIFPEYAASHERLVGKNFMIISHNGKVLHIQEPEDVLQDVLYADIIYGEGYSYHASEIHRGKVISTSSDTISILRADDVKVEGTITPRTKCEYTNLCQLHAGVEVLLVLTGGQVTIIQEFR